MKQIKAMVMGLACLLAAGTANAQWVVSAPGNLAQGDYQYRQTDCADLYNGEEYIGRF